MRPTDAELTEAHKQLTNFVVDAVRSREFNSFAAPVESVPPETQAIRDAHANLEAARANTEATGDDTAEYLCEREMDAAVENWRAAEAAAEAQAAGERFQRDPDTGRFATFDGGARGERRAPSNAGWQTGSTLLAQALRVIGAESRQR